MAEHNLARHLRALCSYTSSISAACRGMGIKRKQFTKYLDGISRPSPRNMHRICGHFGVEEDELLGPHGRLSEMVAPRALGPAAAQIDGMLSRSAESLKPYRGYYFHHDHTQIRPGMIRRSLLRIIEYKGVFYTRPNERIQPGESPPGRSHFVRYAGVAVILDGCMFMIDQNARDLRSLSQTVLFTTQTGEIEVLTGMTLQFRGGSPVRPSRRVSFSNISARGSAGWRRCDVPASSGPRAPVRRVTWRACWPRTGTEPQMLTALELPV